MTCCSVWAWNTPDNMSCNGARRHMQRLQTGHGSSAITNSLLCLYALLFPDILDTCTDQLVSEFATREMAGLDLWQRCPSRRSREGEPMDALRQKWLDTVVQWRLHPEAPANDRYWAPELDTCPRERLKDIQNAKLAVLIPYLLEYSPFYRHKFQQAKLTARDIQSVDDLYKIPPTTQSCQPRRSMLSRNTLSSPVSTWAGTASLSGVSSRPLFSGQRLNGFSL